MVFLNLDSLILLSTVDVVRVAVAVFDVVRMAFAAVRYFRLRTKM